MFRIILLLIGYLVFFSCSSAKKGNQIDLLKTKQEIEAFVHQLSAKYQHFRVNKHLESNHPNCRQLALALKIKPWLKADFDKNGYTDMLVHSRWDHTNYLIVVMGTAKNKYTLKIINTEEGCNFARLANIDKKEAIEYFHFGNTLYQKNWADMLSFSRKVNKIPNKIPDKYRDTLVHTLGNFIEYTSTPPQHHIQAIHFKVINCLGHCPIFDMRIQQNQTATYHAIDDYLRKGHFTTRLNQARFQQIIRLLNYLDFPRLKNHYQQANLTETAIELSIMYDNGKVKKITDTSFEGTQGLAHLYTLIINLRKSEQWNVRQ